MKCILQVFRCSPAGGRAAHIANPRHLIERAIPRPCQLVGRLSEILGPDTTVKIPLDTLMFIFYAVWTPSYPVFPRPYRRNQFAKKEHDSIPESKRPIPFQGSSHAR